MMKKIVSILSVFFFLGCSIAYSAAKPQKPSDLIASAMYNQINLLWTDNSPDEDGFVLERKTGVERYEEVARISKDTEFYLDTGLKERMTYYYRIKATNAVGDSDFSNEAFATTENAPSNPSAPAAPSNLIARVISETEVELRWKNNATNAQGIRIERKTPGNEYDPVGEVIGDISFFADKKVTPKSIYYYRVRSFNSKGESDYSNEILVQTKLIGQDPTDPGNAEEAPQAPTDLAGELKEGQVILTWKDNATNEDGYRVHVSIGDFNNYALYKELPKDTTTYTDANLNIPGTTFFFKVTAFNGNGGDSVPSNEVMIRIKAADEEKAPNGPTELKMVQVFEKDVVLEWKDNADNEDGYKLERRKATDSKFEVAKELPRDMTAYRDEGLEPGTVYFYRVFAFNAAGSSNTSNTIEVVTKGGSIPPVEKQKIIIILQIGSRKVSINGKVIDMDVTPTVYQGRTILPIRYVVEGLGGKLVFEANTKKITITLREITILMQLNVATATVNGKVVQIDPANAEVKPMVVPPGRTLVPLRFVAENLGCQVDWNANEKKITITYEI
jgi:titin